MLLWDSICWIRPRMNFHRRVAEDWNQMPVMYQQVQGTPPQSMVDVPPDVVAERREEIWKKMEVRMRGKGETHQEDEGEVRAGDHSEVS